MEIKRLYPGGRPKAFNITYDDGILQDVRFVALLNRYGVPGTFNLNSQLMEQRFCWQHETGMTVTRLSPEEALHLYDGHEVASHTLTHPDLNGLDKAEVLRQMTQDKATLERWFGRPVLGFGIPFDYYSPMIAQCAKEAGFAYSRNSGENRTYTPDRDYYDWRCGIFHLAPELDAYVNGFFAADTELALCQLVGHSYDLDAADLWDKLEAIVARMAGAETVWCATHLDIVQYLKASRAAIVTDAYLYNNSSMPLWFAVNGRAVCLAPGARRNIL